MSTQWRRDNGPCGLDYTVLHHRMDRLGLSAEEYDELESDIQVMEGAALAQIHENRK